MPKSLQHGDYSLIMAIESASRPDSWYRVLAERATGQISCDCPTWTFNQRGNRTCSHTDTTTPLLTGQTNALPPTRVPRGQTQHSPFIAATQLQWPGIYGDWTLEERRGAVNDKPYRFVLLQVALGNGGIATGAIAFAEPHHPTQEHVASRVAGWCGYALAAEVARLGGYPMAGQPPEHFRITRSTTAQRRPAPQIGLLDILRTADEVDLGDGLRPAQRAEKTLRFFLGEPLYQQLEQQGFLDVSSVHYANAQRVYRLRRDPGKQRERRVRVMEHQRYLFDYCVVRRNAGDCPEADFFLTNFLQFLSDEMSALSVVQQHNIFSPYSDGNERETLPAIWRQFG